VPQLFHVESYPTIHQMTSTVTAEVKDSHDIAAVIRAIYPCGSITGAPKIRAMEVIAEVESDQRGLYCGSIGRIDPLITGGGEAAFNVAIRTLRWRVGDKSLSIGLGSGIVADSIAREVWQECLAKGRFARIMGAEVDLIETMAFHPDTGIVRLEAHLERMKASAAALGFSFDRHEARNVLHALAFHQEEAARVRLLLARSGAIAIELGPLPPSPELVVCTPVLRGAVHDDYRLHHKTSDRRVYHAPGVMTSPDFQPIFHDTGGMISETAFYNVFVEREGTLLTPPLTSGVLPGVLRGELLANGRAKEVPLTLNDLAHGFIVGNSCRGLIRARLAS
jgi:para-aminobenzoate synthetase/4-amino-4-deoxychorismate lyase